MKSPPPRHNHYKEHEAKPLNVVTRGPMLLQNVKYIDVKAKCGVRSQSFLGPSHCGHRKSGKIHYFHNMS